MISIIKTLWKRAETLSTKFTSIFRDRERRPSSAFHSLKSESLHRMREKIATDLMATGKNIDTFVVFSKACIRWQKAFEFRFQQLTRESELADELTSRLTASGNLKGRLLDWRAEKIEATHLKCLEMFTDSARIAGALSSAAKVFTEITERYEKEE